MRPDLSLLSRRRFLGVTLGSAACLVPAARCGTLLSLEASAPLIHAPRDPGDWPAFREALQAWRRDMRRRLAAEGAGYGGAEFEWASRCFCCGFIMTCDEAFYDPRDHAYRVEALVDSARREFGGFDAVVLWHAYPRLGVDARNQYDFYRDAPGGVLGLRDAVRRFRQQGVRVFLDYNPWDTGTRREPRGDVEVLGTLVQALEVDGLFLDTLEQGSAALRSRLDAVKPGVVLESELALPVERVGDHHLSWAQWFEDSEVPGVLRNKWFERRHIQHQIRRWHTDHVAEIHSAWMNGSGVMVWENVFGSWVGWCPRDRSLLRSMLPALRRFSPLFNGEAWTPLVPTLQPQVYASLWEADGLRLWTVVNRSDRAIRGQPLLKVESAGAGRVDDVIQGTALGVEPLPDGQVLIRGDLAPRGIAGVVAGRLEALGEGYGAWLDSQHELHRSQDWSGAAEARPTRRLPVFLTKRLGRVPAGMVRVVGGAMTLRTVLRVRECGFYESEPGPAHRLADSYRIQHQEFERAVELRPYAIDIVPVTNAQFAEFIRRSGYRPRHGENFLKHWGHGHPPAGEEDHPVVYVDLTDARAFARWAGKRLPTEEEWQLAAEGTERRPYPWGGEMAVDRCNDGSRGCRTTSVRAYPGGRTPAGVYDLCGNVWEWTESERTDGRTRFCVIKGGSYYKAEGSNWYFDGGPQRNSHAAKFLLAWAGLDRCATVGFRCVRDLR